MQRCVTIGVKSALFMHHLCVTFIKRPSIEILVAFKKYFSDIISKIRKYEDQET
jgi:hypothetical protein